ncbi:MAG: cupin domain-containing protein [Eubacteriales bacterium]
MIQNFFYHSDCPWTDLGGGVRRKILAYNDNLMVCELEFEEGAVGALHEHFHEQCTYVVEGEFEFEIAGVKKVISVGDTTFKEANVIHGAVCLKKGKLVDIFTPRRDDFLSE